MKKLLFIGIIALSSCGTDVEQERKQAEESRQKDIKAGEEIANDKETLDALDDAAANAVDAPDFEEDTIELDLGLDDEDFDPDAML